MIRGHRSPPFAIVSSETELEMLCPEVAAGVSFGRLGSSEELREATSVAIAARPWVLLASVAIRVRSP